MEQSQYQAWRAEKMTDLTRRYMENGDNFDFNDLCDIVTILRGEGGCPWDREQDHQSIRREMIEECYEVVEAIDQDDASLLREELGDVLLQIVFHSDIEKEKGEFDVRGVISDECRKMIGRHPHVFGSDSAETSQEVLQRWEVIKNEEKQRLSLSDRLQSVPSVLPALIRADKVMKRAGVENFADREQGVDALQQAVCALKDTNDLQQQMGEVLMVLTRLCRSLDVDAELALTRAVEQMIMTVANNEK